ncbi:four helix bundle protein [Terriglobus albidus]|uniref:four helix bundle protein n=1 Tax=Terriglobus albidus TaxID=1592106 RepID=UPI0021E0158B|nr:four helix bundle protein [Terriglobus albidus]
MPTSYRDLKVWQRSIDLAELIYKLTKTFPREEVFGLSAQMRRASVSIPSNIAEGSGRTTRKDFRQFIVIARGSNDELNTQLILAERLGFGDPEMRKGSALLSSEIGKMLTALEAYLLNTPCSKN